MQADLWIALLSLYARFLCWIAVCTCMLNSNHPAIARCESSDSNVHGCMSSGRVSDCVYDVWTDSPPCPRNTASCRAGTTPCVWLTGHFSVEVLYSLSWLLSHTLHTQPWEMDAAPPHLDTRETKKKCFFYADLNHARCFHWPSDPGLSRIIR